MAQRHFDIPIELRSFENGAQGAVPVIPASLSIADTVSYFSPSGSFRIEFPDGSLFGEPGPVVIADSRVLTLAKDGRFDSRCFVTPPGGTEVGWSERNPESGGPHDVGK